MAEHLRHERGRRFLSRREVLNNHAALVGQPGFRPPRRWYQVWLWSTPDKPLVTRQPAGPALRWARLPLPVSEATTHFAVVGATGSGKSLLIQEFSASVLPALRQQPDQRAFFYDAKGELLPRLASQGITPVLFDPFDERGVAWDLAADIRTPAEARQLARALVPGSKVGEDTFWENTTRNVLAAVVWCLVRQTRGRWTLRDVLLTMRSPARIAALLEQDPDTVHLWTACRGDQKTEANLMASFASSLGRFEVVAALWDRAAEKFSLHHWIHESGGVLLIPNHPRYRETLGPIHRLLFDLIADEVLSLPDSASRRTWFVLDEVRNLGRLDRLYHLANEGRSKGACLVLGLQAIEGFHEVYGEKLGNEILGQCRNKTFLRTDSAATARWVEEHFGQVQFFVEQVSRSSGGSGAQHQSSTTVSHSRRRESLILASEIMKLPPPRPGGVFTLLNDVPSLGCFVSTCGFEELIGAVPQSKPDVPAFIERPRRCQRLADWTARDLKRLKFEAPPMAAPPLCGTGDLLARLSHLADGEDGNGGTAALAFKAKGGPQ